MRHNVAGRKLGRTSEHRKALFANLATELLRHGQIKTTLAKAKELRRVVEPLITKAKNGSLHSRRQVAAVLKSDLVLKNLFDEIAPRFKDTPGGYTRVLKAGFRQGDAAPMAVIMLTEGKAAAPAKKAAKKAAPKKDEVKAEEPVVEAVAEEAAVEAAAESTEAPVEEVATETAEAEEPKNS